MDKNTVIGFSLIAVILGGFFYLTKPSPEEIEAQRRYQDSIQIVQQHQLEAAAQAQATIAQQPDSIQDFANDSLQYSEKFGVFANNAKGEDGFYEIETELLKLKFASKGGRISSVELKNYKMYDRERPLLLFDGDEADFGLEFPVSTGAGGYKNINTSELYFKPVVKTDSLVVMRLAVNEKSYIDYIYRIPKDDYMLRFQVQPVNMQAYLPMNVSDVSLHWQSKMRQQERGRKFEDQRTEIYYKYLTDDVESLTPSGNQNEALDGRVKWVAFKNQFFATILIAEDSFISSNIAQEVIEDPASPYLKNFQANLISDFDIFGEKPLNYQLYFGPNHYKTLKDYDDNLSGDNKLDIQRLVPLGWTLFRWVNLVLVIPMFNFFGSFIASFGLIILLMTLVIKLILFPLTYKSYMSSAKMRVLKPEIEEIHAKIPANKMQERQRATMELYGKVGINPMGGCLPMLLQMPILIAMFSFFPSSIELRQQAFLWADDLSTYDALFSWQAHIPIISEYFGNHLSLFCLLMTIVNIVYTRINMSTMDTGTNQMPGMKTIMQLMPLMFLFVFNNYASGLSYYYFVSTLITIIQMYGIRAMVDDKKILAQLNANRNKPRKKSGFMARLEEAQRQQQKQLEAQRRKGKK